MKSLLSPNLKNFKPYTLESSTGDNTKDNEKNMIKMNANESPYSVPKVVLDRTFESIRNTDLNLYPDTDSTELRRAIGTAVDFPMEQILVGNGSDEMIDVLIKTFVGSGDAVVSHDPTFSMYQVFTEIIGGKYYGVSSKEDFTIDVNGLIEKANRVQAKVVFLCTPNNPTGLTISKEDVIRVLDETRGMVVIDEAYREFTVQDYLPLLNESYPRLIILRTFSKANGLAGVRCGYLLGSPEAVSYLQQIKPPYNLNVFTQKLLSTYLEYIQTPEGKGLIEERISELRGERDLLYDGLQKLPGIQPYPGAGNFICFQVKKNEDTQDPGDGNDGPEGFTDTLNEKLAAEGFKIKKFKFRDLPYYRISMGTPDQNQQMIKTLQKLFQL